MQAGGGAGSGGPSRGPSGASLGVLGAQPCSPSPGCAIVGPSSRKRGREVSGSPLQCLLEQIRRLKLPSVDAATANELLAPFVLDALRHDDKGALASIVAQFGWAGDSFCRAVDLGGLSLLLQKYRYERLQELGSGSYAVVYKARNRETDEVIALKKLRFGFDEQGLPSSTLREISLLKELRHQNIVELKDIIYGFGTNNVYLVLECMDCDLRDLLDAQQPLELWRIKSYLHQILAAVHHAHMHCVMHRDLKPQNILVDGSRSRVKVADFGLARSFLPPFKAYTDKVVTLWYRAPELLLGVTTYSAAIDMWSVGCIFAEMLNREPLFRAESEIGLLHKIFEALGTPSDATWAGVERLAHYRPNFPSWAHRGWSAIAPRLARDAAGLDLLAGLLAYNPEARLSAAQALQHPWFSDVRHNEQQQQQQQPPATAPLPPGARLLAGTSRMLPLAGGGAARGDGGVPAAAQPQLLLQQQQQLQHQLQQQQLQLHQLQHPTVLTAPLGAAVASAAAAAAAVAGPQPPPQPPGLMPGAAAPPAVCATSAPAQLQPSAAAAPGWAAAAAAAVPLATLPPGGSQLLGPVQQLHQPLPA